jgi:phosphate transport system permease protein
VRARGSFELITATGALLVPCVLLLIVVSLAVIAAPAMRQFGVGFLWSNEWNPVTQEFGALSSIVGTLFSTFLAMLIALPASIAIALFLMEFCPSHLRAVLSTLIEMLAVVPSVIYGMWGLHILTPIVGMGFLTAAIVLGIMILPYITMTAYEVLRMVPPVMREAAFGSGATIWEVTSRVTLRYCARGLANATLLGMARALGETMAVTFVIGNAHFLPTSLSSAGNTIASTLANEFAEAVEPVHVGSLVYLGLVLFGISLLVQLFTSLVVRGMELGRKAK